MTQFMAGHIRPNPFRDLVTYPVDPDAVAQLRSAFQTSGFMHNIAARIRDGVPELVYGHTRLQAVVEEYGVEFMVDLVIEDRDDAGMLQGMEQDNNAGGRERPVTMQEAVAAYVRAIGDGTLPAPAVPPKTAVSTIRNAPSFILDGLRPSETIGVPYTSTSITEFFGHAKGKGKTAVQGALAWLAVQEQGVVTPKQASKLGVRGTEDVVTASNAGKRAALNSGMTEDEAVEVARKVAADMVVSGATRHGSRKTVSVAEEQERSIRAHVPFAPPMKRTPPAYQTAQKVLDHIETVFTRTSIVSVPVSKLLDAVADNAGSLAFQPNGLKGIHLDVAIATALRSMAAQAIEYAERIEKGARG